MHTPDFERTKYFFTKWKWLCVLVLVTLDEKIINQAPKYFIVYTIFFHSYMFVRLVDYWGLWKYRAYGKYWKILTEDICSFLLKYSWFAMWF